MKSLLISLVFVVSGVFNLNAQLMDTQLFLFNDFKDAEIFFKNENVSKSKLNYNFWLNQFCFLDVKTDMVNLIKGANEIDYYVVDGNKYVIDGKKLIEYPANSPFKEIVYRKSVTRASRGAYGAPTETAATESFIPIVEAWRRGQFDVSDLRIGKLQVEYKVDIAGKDKQFSNAKQFSKLYPAQEKVIKKYIKDNDVDFNNVANVEELMAYVASIL